MSRRVASGPRSDAALRRGFGIALAVIVAVIVGVGAVIHAVSSGHHRPEGIAERWLADVSETTRRGVRSDSLRRAERIGPVGLATAAGLVPATTHGKAAFTDLEVGKATVAGSRARVPFHLHQYASRGTGPVRDGVVVLSRAGSSWRVSGIDRQRPGERVPSEGGRPPSRAPAALWIGAFALSVVLAAACVLIMEAVNRSAARAPA